MLGKTGLSGTSITFETAAPIESAAVATLIKALVSRFVMFHYPANMMVGTETACPVRAWLLQVIVRLPSHSGLQRRRRSRRLTASRIRYIIVIT